MLKKAGENEVPAYESREDYLGSFKVISKVDEYGRNVASDRSVTGSGMASSDRRVGRSQRSYESGTGSYQVEEQTQTFTNYMAKDINVTYGSMNYSYTPDFKVNIANKWKEGMWSKSGAYTPRGSIGSSPSSLISEEYSSANYLKKNTVAKGLNEMDTEAEFFGKAQFKVEKSSSSNKSDEVALYNDYIGKYKLTRKISISGISRFDRPHLSITKEGKNEPEFGSFVDYVITLVNDGNRSLGPIYLLDLFPPGTSYVSSSLRPSELTANSAQWTLVNLGVGSSSKIELTLNMTEELDSLINRVQVRGGYDDKWVVAENFSALQLGWLSCCPPQLLAAKEGYVDAKDPMLVHYRIILKNRENDTMVASVTDQLSGEMIFLNSSVDPSNHDSNEVAWNVVDLRPGELKIIDYWARALQVGTLVNRAHIDSYYLNGTDSASTDVMSSVEIGGEPISRSGSEWQPPKCFDLNCTQQGFGNDWMPCGACSPSEPGLQDTGCSSCPASTGTGTEEGYEIP